ncbi:MAG: response regulator [Nannocystaceae bacterium]
MASSPDTEREQEFFEALWERLPGQTGEVLGAEVTFEKHKLGDIEEGQLSTLYIATLATEQPQAVDMFLGFDVKSAIAFSGLLVMMQEKVIREKMSRRDMAEDDLDAMGECVNQLTSAITEVVRDVIGPDYHMRFTDGGMGSLEAFEKYAGLRVVGATSKISIGDLHVGKLIIAVPEQMFTGESSAAIAQGEGGGVEISEEEAAAIRQATLDGLGDSVSTAVLLLPIERERALWEATLEKSGLPFVLAKDVHGVRRAFRDGEAGLVIIDADACPSGGLPALAQILSSTETQIPVFLAASNPTRVHLVSCLAAGAASYLVKPLEADGLRNRIEEVISVWKG